MEQEHGRMSKDGVAGEMKRLSVKKETHAELQKLRIKLSVNSFDAVICLLIQFYQTYSEGASSQQHATQEASFPENPSQGLFDDTGSSHVHSKKIVDNPTPEIKLIKKEIEEPQASDDPGAYQTYIATEIQEFEGEWAGDDDVRDDRIEPQSRENLKTRPNEQRLEVAHTEDSSAKRKKVLSLDGEHSGAGLGSLSDDEDGWTEDDDGDKNVIDMKCEISSTQDEGDQHTASQHVWNSEEPTDGYRIGDSSSAAEAGTMSGDWSEEIRRRRRNIVGERTSEGEQTSVGEQTSEDEQIYEREGTSKGERTFKAHHSSQTVTKPSSKRSNSVKGCGSSDTSNSRAEYPWLFTFESSTESIPPGEKPYQCFICHESFPFPSDCQRHMRIHSSEKPYQCNVCKKAFAKVRGLSAHMKVHGGTNPSQSIGNYENPLGNDELRGHETMQDEEKPFRCDICNKSFSRNTNLLNHQKRHTGIKPYQCSICDYSSVERQKLVRHLRSHSGERPFQCTVCGKRFSQSNNMKNHMRLHDGTFVKRPRIREKRHKCSVCDYTTDARNKLVRHIRKHTGERPFECSLCSRRFSQFSNLKSHMKVHDGHGEESTLVEVKSVQEYASGENLDVNNAGAEHG